MELIDNCNQPKSHNLLGMRSKPTHNEKRRRRRQLGGDGQQWRKPKTTIDKAYFEAMQLIEGDSDTIRLEQLDELVRRGASRQLLLTFGMSVGVTEGDGAHSRVRCSTETMLLLLLTCTMRAENQWCALEHLVG